MLGPIPPQPDERPKPHHLEPIQPHILKILMEISKKIGRLEGMMEVLMKEKD